MKNKRTHSAARRLLWIFGIGSIIFGVLGLLIPGQILQWVDIALTSPTASADARALYGGVPLAIGALFLYALREPSWLEPALALGAAVTGGPALARVYSIAASGMPDPLVLIYLVLEVWGFLWALRILRKINTSQHRTTSPEV